jgi:hypothetical protein
MNPNPAHAPATNVSPKTKSARAALILGGVVLLGGSVGFWIAGGKSVESTTSTHAVTGIPTAGQTNTTTLDQTVTSSSGDPSDRSDTLTVPLLGIGMTLLLVGVFLPRISKISFPGGSVELTPELVGEAVKTVIHGNPEELADPESARMVVLEFLDAVTPKHIQAREVFSERFVSDAVEAARASQRE